MRCQNKLSLPNLRALLTAGLLALISLSFGFNQAWSAEKNRLSGVFLVAKPGLESPQFRRTVILVTQHIQGGTVGVIINRPTSVSLTHIFPGNELLQHRADRLHSGGPVSPNSILFLFRSQKTPEHALHVLDNLYLSQNVPLLAEQMKEPDTLDRLRVYAGYAGWAPGQLMAEVSRGDWLMVEADTELIFNTDPEQVWDLLAHSPGGKSI